MDYKIISKSAYEGRIHNRKYNIVIDFYTKKQMNAIYPKKNHIVVGEINNKAGIQCGVADNLDGNPLPVYKVKTHNVLTERVVGCAAVDEQAYLAVVKNVMVKRVLIYGSIFTLISAGIIVGFSSHLFK